jgi:hypothetical protein
MDSLAEYCSIVFVLAIVSVTMAPLRDKIMQKALPEHPASLVLAVTAGPVQFSLTLPRSSGQTLQFDVCASAKSR